MMRYRFNVVGDACAYIDDEGTDFGSPEEAKAHALVVASELAVDCDSYLGCELCVIDQRANELARVPIARAALTRH